MINLINESLLKVSTEEREGKYGDYFLTSIQTGMSITPKKHGHILAGAKAIPWKIASVIAEMEDYNHDNLQVKVKYDQKGPNVLLKSNPENRYDSEVYIIAWPLNGIMKPIPESKEYRIRKAFVAEMDAPYVITAEQDKVLQGSYRKVMYLVIEPNTQLFDSNHKFHTDCISIPFTSYKYTKNGGKKTTIATTMTVDICKDSYQVTVEEETTDPVAKEDFEATKLFHVWTPSEKPRRSNQGNRRDDNRNGGGYNRGGNDRDYRKR